MVDFENPTATHLFGATSLKAKLMLSRYAYFGVKWYPNIFPSLSILSNTYLHLCPQGNLGQLGLLPGHALALCSFSLQAIIWFRMLSLAAAQVMGIVHVIRHWASGYFLLISFWANAVVVVESTNSIITNISSFYFRGGFETKSSLNIFLFAWPSNTYPLTAWKILLHTTHNIHSTQEETTKLNYLGTSRIWYLFITGFQSDTCLVILS